MTDRELFEKALKALEETRGGYSQNLIAALRERLAQPEQEPESFEQWNAKQHGDPEEIGFLQALRVAYCAGQDSMTAGMTRLAQPEQEPVAWMHPDGRIWTFGRGFDKSTFTIPLYTTPPQRKPLTDEKIEEICWTEVDQRLRSFARGSEAKLKEKNT